MDKTAFLELFKMEPYCPSDHGKPAAHPFTDVIKQWTSQPLLSLASLHAGPTDTMVSHALTEIVHHNLLHWSAAVPLINRTILVTSSVAKFHL